MSVPPSAPKVGGVSVVRRKLLPKPPPSVHMLECRRKKRRSPTTSDEEEEDPTWSQPIKKGNEKKQFITSQKRIQPQVRKSGSEITAARTTTETTTPTSSLHRESRPTATLREQQQETMTTPTTSAQQQSETLATSAADLPQQPETQASESQRQSEPIAASSICLLQQSETTTTPTSSVQQQLETLASPRADLPQVFCQLSEIRRQLEQHVANVSQQFANFNQQLTNIHQRTVNLETLLRDRPALSSDTAQSEVTGLAAAGEQLTQEQRCLLRRSPMVTNDEQWAELETILDDSGRYGPFFSALVRTVKDRIVDRSDVHKTANATLRTLVAEPYLAQRVTMAGYKKRKI